MAEFSVKPLDQEPGSLFEQVGFAYERPKGKNHCVMRAVIAPD